MLNELEIKLYTLGKLKGVGNKTLLGVAAHPSFQDISLAECGVLNNRVMKVISSDGAIENAIKQTEEELDESKKYGIAITSFLNSEYPALLNATPDKPAFIHTLGDLRSLTNKAVAIIGTREPSQNSSLIAEEITEYLVNKKWVTVSGLAQGCDTIAHSTTILSGGKTVAVMPHGLQTIEPSRNKGLAKQLLETGGILLSEYPVGTRPRPAHYIARDRIQAGLSRGVIMIQSSVDGGSIFASRAALKYGRKLIISCPNQSDINSSREKHEANIIACEGNKSEMKTVYKANEDMLRLIRTIKSKDDYAAMEASLSKHST